MQLRDVSDRTWENGFSITDMKVPGGNKYIPIATDDIASKIVGYPIKGDDKRLIQFVVQLKREFGPEAPIQYLLNTNKEVQAKLKAMFT